MRDIRPMKLGCIENDSLESILFRLSNHFLFPFACSIILSRLKQILSEIEAMASAAGPPSLGSSHSVRVEANKDVQKSG